jgi:LPS export ABC transporter permease LptF
MVMLGGTLIPISDMVVRKGVNLVDALKILAFAIPKLLGIIIPLSFLLSLLLVMGRLMADNEIIAMRAAGISLLKILNIFLMLGIIFSLFLFIVNDRVVPNSHYRYRSQMKNIYSRNVSALIEPGVFLENFQSYIIYVSDKIGNKLKNVFIYDVGDKQGSVKVTFAKHGEFIVEDDIFKIKLEDGFRDETSPKNPKELYRLNFKVFFMDIPITKKRGVKVDKKPADMTIKELQEKITRLEKIGIYASKDDSPLKLVAELHKRISFSFAPLVFVILGFGVSLLVKHREKAINFGIAFFTGIAYYLLFILGIALIEYRIVPPALGMWFPNVAISLLGGYFIFKNAYLR